METSWEKKGEDIFEKTIDLYRDKWRHLERKKNTNKRLKVRKHSWDEEKMNDILKEKRYNKHSGDEKKITEHYKHSGDEKKLLKDINEIKDLHRDKWRHLERKKNSNKRFRWGYILGIKKLQNMIDDKNAKNKRLMKWYVETSWKRKK